MAADWTGFHHSLVGPRIPFKHTLFIAAVMRLQQRACQCGNTLLSTLCCNHSIRCMYAVLHHPMYVNGLECVAQ